MLSNKVKQIILVATYCSPIIIFLPRLFMCKWYDSLILGATILCALAAVGAVILVVLFYQDFVTNKILDRNVDIISNFLEEIKSIRIDLTHIDKNLPVGNDISLWARTSVTDSRLLDYFTQQNIDPSVTPVLFDVNNYYDELENLVKVSNSVFMPPELQSTFRAIRNSIFTMTDGAEHKSFVKLIFNRKPKTEYNNTGKDDSFATINDYYESVQQLIGHLEDWLRRKSNSPFELNLERKKPLKQAAR
jgi:hypothetical protein